MVEEKEIISYTSWLEKETTPFGMFSLSRRTNNKEVDKDKEVDMGGIGRSTLRPTYAQFVEINKLFMEYIPTCINPKLFMHQLYKMELTGAQILVDNRSCIIVEERKNSIITISEDNKLRTHIKAGLKFVYEFNNVKYLIIGRNLKLNRFMKK